MQIIALDTTTPQLRAPPSGVAYAAPRPINIAPEVLTGAAATSSLSIAQTWNTTGTPTAFDLNVTDTASNASSLLMNLRVGGVSRFSVTKTGTFSVQVGATPSSISNDGVGRILLNASAPNGVRVGGDLQIGSGDIVLVRDAANTLALRNGTNAQAFNVYNTFTDASNFERGFVRWSGNALQIGTDKLGTGVARTLAFQTDGTTKWTISPTGTLENSGTNGVVTWALGVIGGTISIGAATRSVIRNNGEGVISLTNNANNDFGRLQFGGTTSSFPSLKRNGTMLETRLADDSGFAPHAAEWLSVTDGVTAPGAATGRARIYVDAADGDLKVVFADGTVKTIVTDT